MNFILAKIKQRKEASKLKSQLKEITQLLLDVEMKRESPAPLDTYSFPDWRWLEADKPNHQWIQWATEGMVGKYYLSMIHQVRGTLVIIKLNDRTVLSYATNKMQYGSFSHGVKDLVCLESEIPSILEDLKATFNS